MESSIQFLIIEKGKCFDAKQLSIMKKEYEPESDHYILPQSKTHSKELFSIWSQLQNIDIYTNDKYCLSNSLGQQIWNNSGVLTFIKKYPHAVLNWVSNYTYAHETPLEEIQRLAYNSANICLDLCQLSLRFQLFNAEDGDEIKTLWNIFFLYKKKCSQNCISKFCQHNRKEGRFPITDTEWEILHHCYHNPHINLTKYDSYCLGCSKGAYLWQIYRVEMFVRTLPHITLDIASNCNIFSNTCCFGKYYYENGFGSFYEDIFTLAYDSPYWCLEICYYSYQYFSATSISVLLKARDMPSNIISIIVKYIFDNKYIDAFIGTKEQTDIIKMDNISNCSFCGDYVKQYEIGARVMQNFCVCCDMGNILWHDSKVAEFIKINPYDAFRVVSHCKAFDKFIDYNEYEQERGGINEFYSEIYALARESPYICLKLCEASIWNYCLYESIYLLPKTSRKRIVSISLYEARELYYLLEDVICDELIEIIGSYLFEYKRELCKSW